jgi:raffinose/stachyose/melibiose transport system permease protein
MQRNKLTLAASYAIVVVLSALYVLPLLIVVNTSLKTKDEYNLNPNGLITNVHLHNFAEAWQLGKFEHYFVNSLAYTAASVVFTVLLSLFAAFPLARGYVKWGAAIYVFFMISIFLPNPLLPQFKLMQMLGLYNSPVGYVILKTSGTGIVFLMFVGYVKSISRELDEAAGMDGCGYVRFLLWIVFPLMKPVIATGVTLTAIGTWNDIVGPTIYLSSDKYAPITKGLFSFYGQYTNNWPLLACGIMIIVLPLLVLYLFAQKYLVDGALAGAVKS